MSSSECYTYDFRHNAELFSKLAFSLGKYEDYDMSDLDITTVRDYATFMALSANYQGKNGEIGLHNLKLKMGLTMSSVSSTPPVTSEFLSSASSIQSVARVQTSLNFIF